jgi:hypothetical protein
MDARERIPTDSRCAGARGYVVREDRVLPRELVTPYEALGSRLWTLDSSPRTTGRDCLSFVKQLPSVMI